MARFGFGSPHKKTSAATSIAVPVNSVAPVIAGDTTDSGLLTISSQGTWSNSPSSYQDQWKSDGVNIPGETGLTFAKSPAYQGHTITVGARGYNGSLGAEAISNAIGPISSASMATPTWTRFGSAGAAPLVMSLSSTDTNLAGYRYQWEFAASLTPTKNGDGSYTTPSQGDVTFLDGDSWARLDQTVPSFNTPSGAFATHCRILRDNEAGAVSVTDALGQTNTYDASAWSTDYTDTIATTTTTLDSTNKSASATLSGGNLTVATVNSGSGHGARSTNQVAAGAKVYGEVLCNAVQAASGIIIAVCNTTFDATAFSVGPGNGNSNGAELCFNNNLYPGAVYSGHDAASTDRYMFCIKRNAGGTTATLWIGVNGTWLDGNPSAETGGRSATISQCYAYIGADRVSNLTVNFGASAFTYALPTGATAWA